MFGAGTGSCFIVFLLMLLASDPRASCPISSGSVGTDPPNHPPPSHHRNGGRRPGAHKDNIGISLPRQGASTFNPDRSMVNRTRFWRRISTPRARQVGEWCTRRVCKVQCTGVMHRRFDLGILTLGIQVPSTIYVGLEGPRIF